MQICDFFTRDFSSLSTLTYFKHSSSSSFSSPFLFSSFSFPSLLLSSSLPLSLFLFSFFSNDELIKLFFFSFQLPSYEKSLRIRKLLLDLSVLKIETMVANFERELQLPTSEVELKEEAEKIRNEIEEKDKIIVSKKYLFFFHFSFFLS